MEQQQWQPQDKQPLSPQQQQQHQRPRLQCPRCHSNDTKFCYYNNYSLTQPRHYCRTCKRFWTQGGTLRNIPEGGRRKKVKTNSPSLTAPLSSGKVPTINAAIMDNHVPVFAGGVGINSYHAYHYGSARNISAFGSQMGNLHTGEITGNPSAKPQDVDPDMCVMRPLLELRLQQLSQQPQHASRPPQPNLMNNGSRGHVQPRPAGWELQPMGAQQLSVAPAFIAALATAVPASAPTAASATKETEVPNWNCILGPSDSHPPPPSPRSSSSTFM